MTDQETFHLSNRSLACELCTDGASLMGLSMKLRSGKKRSLVLALKPSLYPWDPSYSGATLGPCAGRVRGGRLCIDGNEYQLNQNDGVNTLHGGNNGLSHQRFEYSGIEHDFDTERLTFTAYLEDGLDGWPSNRKITVQYTLGPGAMLTIRYHAVADKPTWLDCSSHIYWNLNGRFLGSEADHKLKINADSVILNSAEHLPVSIVNVKGTPFDYREFTSIFQMMDKYKDDKQLLIGRGYNNAFLLNDNVSPAVELESMPGGITMKLFTDQPCVVFYSGGFLGNSQMQDGSIVTPSCALAFEAQNYPDLPNTFPSKFIPLMPGETFSRYIQFELSETAEES